MQPGKHLLVGTGARDAADGEIVGPVTGVSHSGVVKLTIVKTVETTEPAAPGMLGVLRPVVLPDTVSYSPLHTTSGLTADSNGRMPATAVIGPVVDSLGPRGITGSATPRAVTYRLTADVSEPVGGLPGPHVGLNTL